MISKYCYELMIFVFLMIKLFKPFMLVTQFFRFSFSFAAEVALLLALSLALGEIIRGSDEKIRETLLVLTAFFLVSYTSNSVLLLGHWYKGTEAPVNTFIVLSALLVFVLIDKAKIKWLIPFVCFICIAIQPFYMITFLPMNIILFFYKITFGANRAQDKDLFASTLIASGLSFLLFGLRIIPAVPYMREEWLSNLKLSAFGIAITLPFLLLTTAILIIARRNSRDPIFRRIITLILLEPCLLLFAFCTVKSGTNLLMAAVFVQLCFILYFSQIKNAAFIVSCEKTNAFIRKNLFLILLAVVYMASFSNFYKRVNISMTWTRDFYGLWQ